MDQFCSASLFPHPLFVCTGQFDTESTEAVDKPGMIIDHDTVQYYMSHTYLRRRLP